MLQRAKVAGAASGSVGDLRIEDLRVYIGVVDAGSLTAAARNLQLPKSNVSRRLARLEQRLGTRLLNRTTRSLQVTEAGAAFYEHCGQILERLETSLQRMHAADLTLSGHLSVYAPFGFFRYVVGDLIVELARRCPRLRIELLSGAGRPHLLHDNIDVMIHIDEPHDSSLVARPIAIAWASFYASRDYLARAGTPVAPPELLDHDCIVELTHERVPRPWTYREGTRVVVLPVKERYACDTVDLCRELTVQGLGVAMLPGFLCRDEVAGGRLVELFGGRHRVRRRFYAVYASRHFVPAKVRVFVDFLAQRLDGGG